MLLILTLMFALSPMIASAVTLDNHSQLSKDDAVTFSKDNDDNFVQDDSGSYKGIDISGHDFVAIKQGTWSVIVTPEALSSNEQEELSQAIVNSKQDTGVNLSPGKGTMYFVSGGDSFNVSEKNSGTYYVKEVDGVVYLIGDDQKISHFYYGDYKNPDPDNPDPDNPDPDNPDPDNPDPDNPDPDNPDPDNPDPDNPDPDNPDPDNPDPDNPDPDNPDPDNPDPDNPDPDSPDPDNPDPDNPDPDNPDPTIDISNEPTPLDSIQGGSAEEISVIPDNNSIPLQATEAVSALDDTPQTSDDSHLLFWIVLWAIAALALGIIAWYGLRKFRNEC